MATSTVTSKGQLTLPAAIRDHLRVRRGDKVEFRIAAGGEVIVTRDFQDVLELEGALKPEISGVTLDDMDATIREIGSRL